MRIISFVILLLVSNIAVAGGDYVLGKVVSFSGGNGNYIFRFVQIDNHHKLIPSCQEFEVRVTYKRVPWFSWLPFVHASHPTKEKTKEAASFLLRANRENREVNFGYMGYGLVPTDTPCSFLSRGMSLESEKEKNFVLSFHHPI